MTILAYAARYAEPLRSDLEAGANPRPVFLEYDWSLNEARHPAWTGLRR